jgi:hypothetical protein
MSDDIVEVDYIAERDKKFKDDFKKNCDALYADIARTISSQEKDGYSENFYVGPVDFNDGDSKNWFSDRFMVIYDEMVKRNNQAKEKYEKGKAFAEKSGKPFNGNPVFDFSKITYVFHAYDNSEVCVVTNNKNIASIMTDYNSDFRISIDMEGTYEQFFFTEDKPMIARDNYHRLAYRYFIDKGVVKLDEEEELIFGDDLIEDELK